MIVTRVTNAIAARHGVSNAQIAQIRGAAKRTIANQLASAYRKLGGASRARLAALVEASGDAQ